jgi:hypothetical protein
MTARPGVEIAFTDRGGVHWLRAGDGSLREVEAEPVEFYGLHGPFDWRIPSP